MKIVEMKVTPVSIADAPLRNSIGIHEPYVGRIVVELVSEDGISGFGEMRSRSRRSAGSSTSDCIGSRAPE